MKSVDDQLELARKAQAQIDNYTQEQIDEVCLSIGWEVYKDDNIEKLATMAVEESEFGNIPSKITKHKRKVGGVLFDIKDAKTVGCIERNAETGISKYAKPVGIVCAILPATNPTATAGGKAISILKGRNAVIFKASSRAMKATTEAINMMREGLKKVGAPADLIQVLEDPSRDGIGELMKKSDLIVATGSGAVVRAAYSSGTPAYGVGQGNAVAIIAEDANVAQAANMVYSSKFFDYCTSCSSENAVIVIDSVYDEFMKEMIENNMSILVEGEDREKLKNAMWQANEKGKLVLNQNVIAKSIQHIAKVADIEVPEDKNIILIEGQLPVFSDKFYDEKISPVLTVYKVADFKEAYALLEELTSKVGRGHSCGIHTYKQEYIEYLGNNMKTSRITVRQPMSAGNGGHPSNRMPSTATLGCGTWGGNSTTENVHYKHFINVTWVNEPVDAWSFTDDEMWGNFWDKYGK